MFGMQVWSGSMSNFKRCQQPTVAAYLQKHCGLASSTGPKNEDCFALWTLQPTPEKGCTRKKSLEYMLQHGRARLLACYRNFSHSRARAEIRERLGSGQWTAVGSFREDFPAVCLWHPSDSQRLSLQNRPTVYTAYTQRDEDPADRCRRSCYINGESASGRSVCTSKPGDTARG